MTFLLPAALAGLVLVGIPLALHLLRREEIRQEDFPALRYLPPEARTSDRRLRVRERILLALRVAAVVAAVFAAARWLLPVGSAHLPPADLVLVVDDGIGSGAVVEGRRILDLQRELASELLASLGPLDRVWLVPASEAAMEAALETASEATSDPFPRPRATLRLPVSPAEAMDRLGALEPILEPAPVEDAIDRARALLALRPDGPRRVVVVRFDGSRDPRAPAGDDALPGVLEVDPGVPFPENRGILEVEVNGGLPPREGDPVQLRVRVSAADVAVRFLMEGEMVAATRTDPAGEAVLVLPPQEPGDFSGWLELDPDALRLDDRVPVAFRVLPPPWVRVLGNPGAWTWTALSTLEAGGRIRLDASSPGDDPRLAGIPSLPAGSALLVTDEVLLLLPPTDPTLVAGVNRVVAALASLASLPSLASLAPPVPTSPGPPIWLEAPRPGAGFQEVNRVPGLPDAARGIEVTRHYELGFRDGGISPPMALLLDGSPWILETAPPTLRILASPLDPGWTDLPVSAAMIPVLERLLLPSPGGGVGQGTVSTPARLSIPVSPNPVASEGSPPRGWTASVLPERRGRDATPFLAWLLFVILCTEGWLAAGPRSRTRPDPETSSPS